MSDANETRPQTPEHSDGGQAFFTSIGCMDGRVQDPVTEFGRKKFDAQFADTITEAGLVGELAADEIDSSLKESIRFKLVDISLEKHRSKGVIVHGHQECAGNPVPDEVHKENVRKAAGFIRSLVPGLQVIPVFVIKEEESWKVLPLN